VQLSLPIYRQRSPFKGLTLVDAAKKSYGLLASLLGFLVLIRSRPDRTLLQTIIDDATRRLS